MVIGFVCAGAASPGLAQSPQTSEAQAIRADLDRLRQEFDSLRQRYGDRLAALESRLAVLDGGTGQAVAAARPQAAPSAQMVAPVPDGSGGSTEALPNYGGAAAASKVFNPDMAMIGDFLGAAGRNAVSPSHALEMHEVEASFQAVVDPYARADFFISFGEEGAGLEEGYVTFPALPGGLLVKVGKMRGAFGKVNTLHNHVLPWTDRPLVNGHLLGGEDGIDDAGVSMARLIPNPWVFLEATAQVFRGDSGVFRSSTPGDLTYLGHVRGYQDLTESSNVDLGASYAHGHNDAAAGLVTDVYGFDATFRYRPLRRSIYRSLVGRSEVIWSRRDQPTGRQDAVGYYVSGDYQFARRWFAGGRYDRSERRDDRSLLDTGHSAAVTYWPSEFSQVRGQYRRTRYAEGKTANEFLFQFQFSIGAHGAHPF
jgi:hypothetical protein